MVTCMCVSYSPEPNNKLFYGKSENNLGYIYALAQKWRTSKNVVFWGRLWSKMHVSSKERSNCLFWAPWYIFICRGWKPKLFSISFCRASTRIQNSINIYNWWWKEVTVLEWTTKWQKDVSSQSSLPKQIGIFRNLFPHQIPPLQRRDRVPSPCLRFSNQLVTCFTCGKEPGYLSLYPKIRSQGNNTPH